MNDDEEGIDNGDPNEYGYQGPPDCPEIYEIIDNRGEEREANSYDQYIGAEVVLPDQKGEKLMGKVRKRVIYDYTITCEGNYNYMHDNYICEVKYPDGTTEKLAANIIIENILPQNDSEDHQYQVLTEVNEHKKDDSAIANVVSFIKSSSGNLHQKRTTKG